MEDNMNTELEMMIMNIIVNSGSGRSYAMEAIALAKARDIDGAIAALGKSDEALLEAHRRQTSLIRREASGEASELSLLLIHSQDHLMTAMVVKDMAKEFVDLYDAMQKG